MTLYSFESINHNNTFPIKIFHTKIVSSSFHWHYDYEILLVLKGKIKVHDQAQTYKASAGDIILFNSKSVHSLKCTEEENLCLFLQISPDILTLRNDPKRQYSFYLNSVSLKNDYGRFISLISQIGLLSLQTDSISSNYYLHGCIYQLLGDLFQYVTYDFRQLSKNEDFYNDPDTIGSIINYVDTHYTDSTIANDLQSYIGMSQKTLYRFLKSHMGITLTELVKSVRFEHAKTLLKTTNRSIAAIASECGYQNEVSFHRSFKKEALMTPSEYRRHGNISSKNTPIQDYVSSNPKEAISLMKQYAKSSL